MTLQSFPDVDDAAGWYDACQAGLSALEQIVQRTAKGARQDWSDVESLDDLILTVNGAVGGNLTITSGPLTFGATTVGTPPSSGNVVRCPAEP